MLNRRALYACAVCLACCVSAGAEEKHEIERQALYVAGEGGYHTYRIPALVATTRGTLLAFCEGRRDSRADHGNIDLLLRRSTDGGRSWTPQQVVWDDGEHTIGNPCPLVDRKTGAVWLSFTRDNDDVFVARSDDEGRSWARPREITADVKRDDWTWYATGPGHGIQLSSGRLLVPCDHRVGGLPRRSSLSHVIYSDDGGGHWKLGGSVVQKTNECTAAELSAGAVYLNMRSNFGHNRRAYALSRDGGLSWSEVAHDPALIEPVCQGSVLRIAAGADGKHHRLLFSNPAGTSRAKLTVRVSSDDARSWSVGKVLCPGPSAYSDLCRAADGAICCLYERGDDSPYEQLEFARFSLRWLEDAQGK